MFLMGEWTTLTDACVAVTSRWARLYFVAFYLVGVVGVLNLLVARVVDEHQREAAFFAKTNRLVRILFKEGDGSEHMLRDDLHEFIDAIRHKDHSRTSIS